MPVYWHSMPSSSRKEPSTENVAYCKIQFSRGALERPAGGEPDGTSRKIGGCEEDGLSHQSGSLLDVVANEEDLLRILIHQGTAHHLRAHLAAARFDRRAFRSTEATPITLSMTDIASLLIRRGERQSSFKSSAQVESTACS